MGHAEHELVLYGRHPGVVVQLEDGPGAEEVEAAEGGRQHRQPVALQVQLPQQTQLANLLNMGSWKQDETRNYQSCI